MDNTPRPVGEEWQKVSRPKRILLAAVLMASLVLAGLFLRWVGATYRDLAVRAYGAYGVSLVLSRG